MNEVIILRKSDDIETVSGILVMNGYTVERVQIKDPIPKNRGFFTGIHVIGNGSLPKVKGDEE